MRRKRRTNYVLKEGNICKILSQKKSHNKWKKPCLGAACGEANAIKQTIKPRKCNQANKLNQANAIKKTN